MVTELNFYMLLIFARSTRSRTFKLLCFSLRIKISSRENCLTVDYSYK